MTKLQIRGLRFLLAAACLLWMPFPAGAATLSSAQEAAPLEPGQETAQGSTQEPAEPETIPLAEIPSRAEGALAFAVEIQSLLQLNSAVNAIEAQFPATVTSMDAAYADFRSLDLELASARRIRDLRQVWARHQATLTGMQSMLVPRREDLQESGSRLRNVQALWERTRDSVADVELPEGVGERLTEVLQSLGATLQDWEARLSELLTLESRVSEKLQRANEVLRELSAAEATARQRLLQRDSAPLWDHATEVRDETLIAQATDSYVDSVKGLRQFLTAESDSFVLHVVLFVLLLVSLTILRQWSLSWEVNSEPLERAKFVLSKPGATAFLLSLFATQFIYEPVPDVVRELTLILTLIPVLRLLPGIFKPLLRPGLYGFLGLFFMGHVLELISQGSLLYRLTLLLVAGAGMAVLIWFLRRPPWPGLADLSLPWRTVRRGLQFGAGLLGVAAVANVLGWLRLSGLLLTGTLYSAYLAIVAYALWATLTGVVAALPYTPLSTKIRSIDRHGALITRRASAVISVLCGILWLRAMAIAFDVFEPLYGGLSSLLSASYSVGALSLSLGMLLTIILVLWLARLISRFVRFLLQEEIFPRIGLGVGESEAVATLTHYLIGAIAIVAVAAAIGITGTQIAMLIGALGVGIGFGLQSIVNNFISGLILIFERPIKVGDMVEIGQLLGTVKRIGIRASIVRTFDGAEVVVPNGDLIAKEVINWTLSDQVRRRELRVGVEYGNEPEQVLELLAKVAGDHPEVFDTPEPMILFQGFDDGMMNFSLRYWVPIAGSLKVASEVAVAVNAALREAGIKIPIPQREIFVHSADDEPGEGRRELRDDS